jgi:ATP-dependent DNA ligase
VKEIYETEILQATAKSGKTKYWQKQIVEMSDGYFTRSVYWQDDSVVQYSEPKRIEKKNVGRANETSELEQARLEVESEFKRQLDKGYSMSGDRSLQLNFPLPMLAQDYMKHQDKLPEQVLVEPKLDGCRMMADGVNFWTRKGKLN